MRYLLINLLFLFSVAIVRASAPVSIDFTQVTSIDDLNDGMPVYLYTQAVPWMADGVEAEHILVSVTGNGNNGLLFRPTAENKANPLVLRKFLRGYALYLGDEFFVQYYDENKSAHVIYLPSDDDIYTDEMMNSYEDEEWGILLNISFAESGELIVSPICKPALQMYACTPLEVDTYSMYDARYCNNDCDDLYTVPIYLASEIKAKLANKPIINMESEGDFLNINVTSADGCQIFYALRPVQDSERAIARTAEAAQDYDWKEWSPESWQADYATLAGEHWLMVKAREGDLESDIEQVKVRAPELTGCASIEAEQNRSTVYYNLQGMQVSESAMRKGQIYIKKSINGFSRVIIPITNK